MRFKEILTYFLIASIFLSNSIGLIIVFNQIKYFHKQVIKSSIKNSSYYQVIEILSFSKSDLKNGKHNIKFIEEHEFRYNGRMYDIIESWETDDTVVYKCINDTREEQLEEAFVQYVVNNQNRQDLPLPIKQILSFLNLDLYFNNSGLDFSTNKILTYLYQIKFNLLENIFEVPEPPPRFT